MHILLVLYNTRLQLSMTLKMSKMMQNVNCKDSIITSDRVDRGSVSFI